ncbi:MAG: ATP-dependent helicase HrpB [Bdellovibrionia bacterium]
MQTLPIDKYIPEILEALEESPNLILKASPGSGKTTRVPPAVLKTLVPGQDIIVLEPRRLAAKLAATRVAFEWGDPVGETIGYQFRFEDVTSKKNRLKFLTEGMLIRKLIRDPKLTGVGVVFLDEFHERHLHTDVALSYLRNLQKRERPDLKIIVMSATLEAERLSQFLGNAPLIEIDAPGFEVVHEYRVSDSNLEIQITKCVREALEKAPKDSAGRADVLVFLPGMGEIRRAQEALSGLAKQADLSVLPLHGDLTREEQDLALQYPKQRKIILSTNVAETSVTIPGVTAVIDSGLARVASYSFWSGLPSLKTKPISRASATQRAGRAGRTAPGICYHLYAKSDLERRPAFEKPEIQRADLSQTLLELKMLNADGLEWFEAPGLQSEQSSLILLKRIGALDKDSKLTDIGRKMAEFPVHPRLSRVLLDGDERGAGYEAATLAALLSEGENHRLNLLEDLDSKSFLVKRTRDRLVRFLKNGGARGKSGDGAARAVLTGFPDRVAKLSSDGRLLVLCDGGSAQAEDPALKEMGEFFICTEVQELQRGTHKRTVAESLVPIEPEWLLELENDFLTETNEVAWDPARKAVFEISRLKYGQLILSESRGAPKDRTGAIELLVKNIGIDDEGIKTICDLDSYQSFRLRLDFVKQQGAVIPEFDIAKLMREFCESVCDQKFSTDVLKNADFLWFIQDKLGDKLRAQLQSWAPESLTLPSGRKTKINYSNTQPPWIESRLQDFFGMRHGPTLANGKVPLTLHLLAPNYRAVQVTSDLMSFWKNVYPKLRVELGRRYPRHKWPENPLA